jgi:hypothetical protein
MNGEFSVELPNVDRMIEYCTGIANEFLARLNRIRSFIPEHNLTSGTANEMILRNFLSEFSMGKYAVGQGFISDPTIPSQATGHTVSKQCDIIVYDRDCPLVHSEGEVKVVWPRSVKMFIEVKTNLNNAKTTAEALENICIAKRVPYMNRTPGLIFAFKSSRVKTVVEYLREYPQKLSPEDSPIAVLLLEKGAIIHRWSPVGPESAAYEVRRGHVDEKATVMAFLVMFYFDILMTNTFLGSSIVNMLRDMLEYRTNKILDDFMIGDHT